MKRKYKVSILLITFIFIFWIFVTKGVTALNFLNIGEALEGKIVVSVSEKIGIINPNIHGLFMEMKFKTIFKLLIK